MKTVAPALILILAAALAAPSPALAQEPVTSFDQLSTRLKPGDTVYVTDAQGREIKGKIRDLSPSALTLEGDSAGTLQSDAVRFVKQRKGKPIAKGAWWGLAVGGGLGITWLAIAAQDSGDGNAGIGVAILGGCAAIGAGVGAAIGAAVPAKTLVVYRAPGAPGSAASARFSVTPVITPRAKGVAVSVAF